VGGVGGGGGGCVGGWGGGAVVVVQGVSYAGCRWSGRREGDGGSLLRRVFRGA